MQGWFCMSILFMCVLYAVGGLFNSLFIIVVFCETYTDNKAMCIKKALKKLYW